MEQTIISVVQAIGVFAVLALIAALYIRDGGKANNQTELTIAKIAGDSTTQIAAVYKDMGALRQELGMAQGQYIASQDNFKAKQLEWQATQESMKDKLRTVQDTVERQSATISRHEGRIAELETESTRKTEIINAKEAKIVELATQNTRLQGTVDNQASELERLNKSIQLVTRAQTLDDTIQFTAEEIAVLADPAPIVVPSPETTEKKDIAAWEYVIASWGVMGIVAKRQHRRHNR